MIGRTDSHQIITIIFLIFDGVFLMKINASIQFQVSSLLLSGARILCVRMNMPRFVSYCSFVTAHFFAQRFISLILLRLHNITAVLVLKMKRNAVVARE